MMIDESIHEAVKSALRQCYDDGNIVMEEDGWFDFGASTKEDGAAFIEHLLRRLTVEQRGDFIQDYLLNMTAKEAGEAFGEACTSCRVNPLRELAVACAARMLDTEYCQVYLAGLAN